jgi:NitT/TauT family transport system substrate-binding protein
MMHRFAQHMGVVAAAVGVAAAALTLASSAGAWGQGAKPLAKVTLRLDWKPGAQHAPFYFAKAKGYYAAEGLDVTIVPGSGSSDAVKLLGAHSVDVALVDGLVLVQAVEQGVPARAVAVYYQRTPIVLISPADRPIDNLTQLLANVRLGVKKGSATYQGLIALLAANKIKPEQVHLVDIGFGVQPLLVHQVDALMGFVMNEPIEAEDGGMKVHELLIADHGVHAYGLTIASNDRFMMEHPDQLKAFLRATIKAMHESATETKGAVEALVRAVSELDATHELKVLDRTIPFWTGRDTQAHGIGWQTDAGWTQTVDTAKLLGLIDTRPKPAAVYTDAFLRQ